MCVTHLFSSTAMHETMMSMLRICGKSVSCLQLIRVHVEKGREVAIQDPSILSSFEY